MPKYKYQLTNGKTLTLEGDTQPSDDEVESLAKEQNVQLAHNDTADPPDLRDAVIPESKSKKQTQFDTTKPEGYKPVQFPLTSGADEPELAAVEHEPDTYLGGFIKGLKDYGREITSGIHEALQSAAHPQTAGDLLNLIIPSELPHIARRGKLSNIADSITSKEHDIPVVNVDYTPGHYASDIAHMKASGQEIPEYMNDLAKGKEVAKDITTQPRPAGPWDDNIDLATKPKSKSVEDKIYDNARDKFGMGQDNPELTSQEGAFNPDSLQGLEKKQEPKFDLHMNTSRAELPSSTVEDTVNQAMDVQRPAKPRYRANLDKTFTDMSTGETVPQEVPKLAENNAIGMSVKPAEKKSLWGEFRDANRALLTAFDFSAPGRQGKPLLMTKAYWTSFDDMFKAWGSENAYKNVIDSIHEHPNFQAKTVEGKTLPSLAERAGLDIHGKEEMFQSNLADKYVPGVRMSEHAYTAFLSKLRADHFNTMLEDARRAGMNPDADDTVLKSIGSFINDATGRGSLGKLERAAPILNEVFFAPRLMASRVNMYKRFLDPRTYANANPIVRKQAIKSLLSTVGLGTAVGELARIGGAKVSNDPRSSDFRKIKIGNTRIDPFSGFQQYAVGASRLLSGELVSSKSGKEFDLTSGKFGMPTRASVASQFFQNKLAPIPSLVWSWMEGKDWDGQPFELKKALLDRTVPIVMQDLQELYEEDPKLLPLGVLPMMGEGIQTYAR